LRRWSHPILWAVVAGFFGLLFGTLCSIPYFLTGGWGAGIGYIIQGIPFDITHAIGNIASVLLLYFPLEKVLKRVLPQ
jgi:energy-coupling factor transport system substrate-specific component